METAIKYQEAIHHYLNEIAVYEAKLKDSVDELQCAQIEVELALAQYSLSFILAEYQETPH